MKKGSCHACSLFTGFVFSLLLLPLLTLAYPSGSPAGYTGSPGDGHHCQSCHGGSNATVSNWITTNIPSQGYTAGSTYTITVTVSGTGKKGFEVSPQNVSGTQLGVLAAGSGNHLVGGTKYVTQNSSGSSSGTATWSFSWTAPAAGSGTVTLYGAFTVGKTNTKLSTLDVIENTAVPLAVSASANPNPVCAGQTVQLSASPSGGSGNYTYSWTSNPPGFTSTLQNPVANPTEATVYTVTVNDGSASVSAPAGVAVSQNPTVSVGNDTTVANATTQLYVTGTVTNPGSYLWSTSGTGTFSAPEALTGLYFPSQADKDAGSVTLTLTVGPPAPCTVPAVDSRVVHFDGPVGMTDKESTYSLILTPNPTSGRFTASLKGAGLQGSVVVTDLLGNHIATTEANGETLIPFDLTGRQAGIYFVTLQNGTYQTSGKILLK